MSMNGSERLSGAEERALDCLVHGLAHVVATYGREEGQRLAAQAVLLINEVEDGADIAPSEPRCETGAVAGANGLTYQANTTGVAMPPKCGNPSLTDQDLADVVAYLRTLQ